MENEEKVEPVSTETKVEKKQTLGTPAAIVVAGFLIMLAILITQGGSSKKVATDNKDKPLSEQVGVSKDKLTSCIASINKDTLQKDITTSVEGAMKALKPQDRGTPYTVVVGKNGIKTEIRGADSYENVKKLLDDVAAGKAQSNYKGELPPVTEKDHIMGDINAPIMLVEYSDFECPYCKMFQATLKKVVSESNGQIAWTYRHWPIHQNSVEKLMAAECVAQLKGNDAFWKYGDLLFDMLKTGQDPVTDQL